MSPTPDFRRTGPPSKEFRNTLDALLLASVNVAEAATQRQSFQFVLPKVAKWKPSINPRRTNDVRIITNNPDEKMVASCRRLNTGGYQPYFLDTTPGLQYRADIEVIAKLRKRYVKKYMTAVKARARNSSFSYIEGQHIVTIFASKDGGEIIRNWKEFADACGLVIGNSAKISKRLKEVVRLTRMFVRLNSLSIKYFEDYHPDLPQEYVDGASIIRRSVALKMCRDPRTRRAVASGKLTRISIRVITPAGLIKGDALIVPDGNIKCDVYTSKHNMKPELATKSGFVLTGEPHHPSAPARTNDQLLSWFKELFPLSQLKFAVRMFLSEGFRRLAAGQYPTYLTSLPKLKDGVDSQTLFKLASHKWLGSGRALNESSSLIRQAGKPLTQQLISDPPEEWDPDLDRYVPDYSRQKVRAPIVWAFYGHFMTDTVIELAGYKIPKAARGKLFFHAATGSVVIPAHHFRKYYRNHGGWDLDDSAMVVVRKIDGVTKAIIVRSPNSWGEYSIIDVYMEGLPLYFTWGDIPEVDSAVLPTQIHQLVYDEPDKDRTLPEGTFDRDDHDYGHADFDYALECALINPGTGSLINRFCIAYNAIFGTYNRDPWAETEDVVDFTQQKQAKEPLLRLRDLHDEAGDLYEDVLRAGQPIDPLIFERRLNFSDELKDELRPVVNMVPGIFSELKSMIEHEVDIYTSALEVLSTVPVGEQSDVRVGKELFMRTFSGGRVLVDLSSVDLSSVAGTEHFYWGIYTKYSINASRLPMKPEARREHWQGCSRELVTQLMSLPEEKRHLVVLNLLAFVQDEGKSDTYLFATPGVVDGVVERAPLDVLLDAMVRHGLADSYLEFDEEEDVDTAE